MDFRLRNARIIQTVLPTGVLFFASVVLFLYHQGPVAAPTHPEQIPQLMQTMSLTDAILFVVSWAIAIFLQQRMQTGKIPLKQPVQSVPDAQAARWQTGRLLGLAPREGSAFFGLVVCLVGVQNGSIYSQPIYWLNVLPAVLMVVYAVVSFPTQEDFDRFTAGTDPAASIIH